MAAVEEDSSGTRRLLERIRRGDSHAVQEILGRARERLLQLVASRIDQRIRGRVDPSDVVQEVSLEAAQRLPGYCSQPQMPFARWIRFLAFQKLAQFHRRHLAAQIRDVRRERPIRDRGSGTADPHDVENGLLVNDATPGERALRREALDELAKALEELDPIDCAIIELRHFDQLSTVEAAELLGINPSTLSTRHIRALKQLRELLDRIPDLKWILSR